MFVGTRKKLLVCLETGGRVFYRISVRLLPAGQPCCSGPPSQTTAKVAVPQGPRRVLRPPAGPLLAPAPAPVSRAAGGAAGERRPGLAEGRAGPENNPPGGAGHGLAGGAVPLVDQRRCEKKTQASNNPSSIFRDRLPHSFNQAKISAEQVISAEPSK